VDCLSTNLQTAIDSASPGATLAVTGTCSGNFTIGKNLTLTGQDRATLDGKHAGTTLTVSSGATVTLAGLTVTGGTVSGIRNQGALTLNNVTVRGNSSSDDGGGLYNNGTITLQGTTLSNNSATNGTGGGLFNCCVSTSVPNVIRASRIIGNTAASGGGVENLEDSVTLQNTVVIGNRASTYYGGGLNNGTGGTATLENSVVAGNYAHVDGGGVDVGTGSTVTLNGSHVAGNSPDNCAPPGAVTGCV
jgi:predicted outer membrane repeat protein